MERQCGIKDIAKISGVSPTTVQNVLRGRKERMREETYQKVLSVIQECGFVEKAAPKLLNGKDSRVMGIVIAEKGIKNVCLPAELCYLVQENYKKNHYTLLYVSSGITEIIRFFKAWPMVNLYLWGFEDEDLEMLKDKIGIPVNLLL